jgi:hypothetical protein
MVSIKARTDRPAYLPASVASLDQALCEDFKAWYACRQLCGAFGPLPSASQLPSGASAVPTANRNVGFRMVGDFQLCHGLENGDLARDPSFQAAFTANPPDALRSLPTKPHARKCGDPFFWKSANQPPTRAFSLPLPMLDHLGAHSGSKMLMTLVSTSPEEPIQHGTKRRVAS